MARAYIQRARGDSDRKFENWKSVGGPFFRWEPQIHGGSGAGLERERRYDISLR